MGKEVQLWAAESWFFLLQRQKDNHYYWYINYTAHFLLQIHSLYLFNSAPTSNRPPTSIQNPRGGGVVRMRGWDETRKWWWWRCSRLWRLQGVSVRSSGCLWFGNVRSMWRWRVGFRCDRGRRIVVAIARFGCHHPPQLSDAIELRLEKFK